jgi:predicted transcriptional regulator
MGQAVSAVARTITGRPNEVQLIPQWYDLGMSVQMTIRVDDDLAAFIDQAAKAGEGSRADVINRVIKREIRRRAAAQDAQVYASSADPDLESDAYAEWATRNASQVWSELD